MYCLSICLLFLYCSCCCISMDSSSHHKSQFNNICSPTPYSLNNRQYGSPVHQRFSKKHLVAVMKFGVVGSIFDVNGEVRWTSWTVKRVSRIALHAQQTWHRSWGYLFPLCRQIGNKVSSIQPYNAVITSCWTNCRLCS